MSLILTFQGTMTLQDTMGVLDPFHNASWTLNYFTFPSTWGRARDISDNKFTIILKKSVR